MIPTKFDYRRASSVEEAVQLLAASNGDARLLAGGHSLIPLMKLRLSEPAMLIDIGRIPDLRGVSESGGRISIGAATTYHELVTSHVLQQQAPIVSETAEEVGDPQVRHRGTIGGSLAHADPAGDMPAVVLALGATLHAQGPNGARTIDAADFFQDLFTVDLGEDEILTRIEFAPVRSAAYAKLHQRASHYAIVGVAAALEVEGGTCRSARIGITGAGAFATRLANVEEALAGQALNDGTIRDAAAIAPDGLDDLNEDLHASASYRREMVKVFTRRALEAAAARG